MSINQFFSNITVMCNKMTTELNESVKAQMMGNHVETISLCLVINQRTDTVSLSLHNEMWQLQKLILHWKEDEKWVKLNFKPLFFTTFSPALFYLPVLRDQATHFQLQLVTGSSRIQRRGTEWRQRGQRGDGAWGSNRLQSLFAHCLPPRLILEAKKKKTGWHFYQLFLFTQ